MLLGDRTKQPRGILTRLELLTKEKVFDGEVGIVKFAGCLFLGRFTTASTATCVYKSTTTTALGYPSVWARRISSFSTAS